MAVRACRPWGVGALGSTCLSAPAPQPDVSLHGRRLAHEGEPGILGEGSRVLRGPKPPAGLTGGVLWAGEIHSKVLSSANPRRSTVWTHRLGFQ